LLARRGRSEASIDANHWPAGLGRARVGNEGVASCAIFISSSRDGPIPRVGSAMLASMACPCQETERVSPAWAETANALVNASVKQTDNPRMMFS
jgi:hypothetical protein